MQIAVLLVVVVSLTSACAAEPFAQLPGSRQSGADPLTHGTPTDDYPEVVVFGADGHGCSGTLIGRYTVLTAAHCLYRVMGDGGYPRILFGKSQDDPAARRIAIHSWTIHPGYSSERSARADLALVFLLSPVDDIARPVLGVAPRDGEDVTLVGYGRTAESRPDNGIRRVGTAHVSSVSSVTFDTRRSGALPSGVCGGDSGGGVFRTIEGRRAQLGVVSQGTCVSLTVAVRIDTYLPWIRSIAGADLDATAQRPAPRPAGEVGPHGSTTGRAPSDPNGAMDPCAAASACGGCVAIPGCVYCADLGSSGCMLAAAAADATCNPRSWAQTADHCAVVAARNESDDAMPPPSETTPNGDDATPEPTPMPTSGPDLVPSDTRDPCTAAETSCGACTSLAGCGFCGGTGACLSGSVDGPDAAACDDWRWLETDCE